MNVEQEQWLTGFWEGDGACYVGSNTVPTVSIEQDSRGMLEYVQSTLGFGHVYTYSGHSHFRVHKQEDFAKLAALLSRCVVGEQSNSKLNLVFERLGLSVKAQRHVPTMPWVVGFFDAEGSIDWNNQGIPSLYFSQKSPGVLLDIQSLLGGSMYPIRQWHHLYPLGDNLRNFLPNILWYSHHEPKRQKLTTMIYVLARDGNGVWSKWAREVLRVGEQ